MRKNSVFRLYYLIPLIVAALVTSVMLLPQMQNGDRRIFDLFMHLKPAVKEDNSILLLDIDDLAIAQVGTWPWSRSVVADGLILLSEFDAEAAVFDIEYVDKSPLGIDSRYLEQKIPALFQENFSVLGENVTAFFTALVNGDIPLNGAESYISDLKGINQQVMKLLLDAVRSISRDNDAYLGQALNFFGNGWITVNMLPNEVELAKVSDDLKSYVKEHVNLKNIRIEGAYTPSLQGPSVQPAIMKLLSKAAGAGFPNVVVDNDGVRRRIDLLAEYDGKYFGQLAFAPLLKRLGNPQIIAKPGSITLKGEKESVTIPLDGMGRMLINWPPKIFDDSFRHLSYNSLVVHGRLEEQIVANLKIMEEAGYLDFYKGQAPPMDLYRYAEQLKEDLLAEAGKEGIQDRSKVDEYREIRKQFFEECTALIAGDTERAIIGEIDRLLSSGQLNEEQKKEYEAIKAEVTDSFAAIATDISKLSAIRESLSKELSGAFVIIGHTGISTTDIGVNPFAKEYMNVGTHAAVVNTILQKDFLRELPLSAGVGIALLFTLLLSLLIRRLSPLPSILVGIAFILGTFGAGLILFLSLGWYLPLLTPLLMISITFLSISLIKFLKTEGEKSFLRTAFGHYLSNEVINQLIDEPERLNLGGEKKRLTAMFTDIRGFSTISEQLDPTELVTLLNNYLTGMSDIILEQFGTIDKYEGDAIIAFFGAPVDYQDHAWRACHSAIRMKRVEKELNKRFLDEKMAPGPLMTRIGINTGEMVVGNMGTLQKMDYTIMGNAVNLAARLEGVNKRYGTWILISEETRKGFREEFVVRKLDRVRVVGINTPVRLYELVEETSHIDDNIGEGLELFDRGMNLFEAWDWEEAKNMFSRVLKMIPGDGPSLFFIDRAEKFMKTQPPKEWDGVFNLTLK